MTVHRSTWKKVLYTSQPFPDNYSGGETQFLKELRKNISVVSYRYVDAAIGACNLLFHLDCVTLFYILFKYISSGAICVDHMLVAFTIFVSASYAVYSRFLTDKNEFLDHFHTLVCLLSFGFALTPAIRTLTATISTDTIYAMSFLLGFISCVFHDYGIKAPIVSFHLSVSSGLCSAIFLISRLTDNAAAFGMLSIAFVMHACSAPFRNAMFASSPWTSVCIASIVALFTITALFNIYVDLAMLFIVVHLFIAFVCPWILIVKQKSKCNIHGPWDEAVPTK